MGNAATVRCSFFAAGTTMAQVQLGLVVPYEPPPAYDKMIFDAGRSLIPITATWGARRKPRLLRLSWLSGAVSPQEPMRFPIVAEA